MTFAVKKQIVYQNRVYDIESVSIINGQAFADATYKVNLVTYQLCDDDIRQILVKGLRN